MKYSIDILKQEAEKATPIIQDREAVKALTIKIRKWMEEKEILPPNENIRTVLIRFLVEHRLGYRKKGLFLAGGVGTGKTFACKIISTFKGFQFYEASKLRDMYTFKDEKSNYVKRETMLNIGRSYTDSLIVDDMGAEAGYNDYGVPIEPLGLFIDERVKAYVRAGALTVITSNLSAKQFKERYKGRTFSRINQICEPVICNGPDLRIIK